MDNGFGYYKGIRMNLSNEFEQVYEMSKTLALRTSSQYQSVAFYLGRVFIAEQWNDPKRHPWSIPLIGKRDIVLQLVSKFTDEEWAAVSEYMRKAIYSSITPVSPTSHGEHTTWVNNRLGWITDLDTIRAFG